MLLAILLHTRYVLYSVRNGWCRNTMQKRSVKPDVRQLTLVQGMGTPKEVFRSLRNYLAGQFVGATRDETLLDELLKCLFCKLYIELELVPPLKSETSSIDHAKAIRGVFS